jgi:nicotinamidase-related amidase
LIAAAGEGMCFLIDGLSYVAVIASLLMMRVPGRSAARAKTTLLSDMREGWDYIRSFRPVRTVLVIFALTSLMGYPFTVLLPVFTRQMLHGGPHLQGWLTAASGVRALISALSLTVRRTPHGLPRMIQVSAGLLGVALILFGLSKVLWLSLPVLSLAGFGLMQTAAASNTVIQTLVPEDKRARVISYYAMAFYGAAPFGSLLAGALADRIGAAWTVAATGVACILGSVWFATQVEQVNAALRALLHPSELPSNPNPRRSPMKLDPTTTAMLTLDLQHGILSMLPDAQAVLAPAKKAVSFARAQGMLLIHVGLGFSEGHPEIPDAESPMARVKQNNLFVKGTPSAAFHEAVAEPRDLVVYKQRISAFSENQLELILRARGVRHLVLFGVATSGIVLSTLRRAFDLDFRCTVLKEACFDADPEVHRVLTEKVFARQATVTSVDDFVTQAT